LPDFETCAPFDIAERLELLGENPHSWTALITTADNEGLLDDVTAELSAILHRPVRVLPIAQPINELSNTLQEPADDIVILTAGQTTEPDQWSAIDMNRSRLERDGPLIFWISDAQFAQISRNAPNIRSYIGGSVFRITPDADSIDDVQRRQRLSELSSHYGWTNDELISKAANQTLPAEPEFVEWLVLLDRGDLI
jgi:hypothetical protein